MAPKMELLGYFLQQKQTFYKKCKPCDFIAPASIIQGSDPSERDQLRLKNKIFAHMKPLPVFDKFFLTFELFLGASWPPECFENNTKNVFKIQPVFWLPLGDPGGWMG